ncbi:MAG: hypothetical protein RLZ53_629 [Actinomycetota bacterium]|jgi:hypothetical protein
MAKTGIESKGKFSDRKHRAKLAGAFASGVAIGALAGAGGGVVGGYWEVIPGQSHLKQLPFLGVPVKVRRY